MGRSISVAMIVKDESAQLAECLSGIAGFADEICLIDTGSRDNTVEIARQHKAKVTFFIWCDDFAAARNESLRKCTKDWIFVLDADERVAPEDFAQLRQLVEGPANVCYRFETRNYTNTESVADFHRCRPDDPHRRGFAGWYPSSKVRLFPNNSGARFTGTVHELVNESLEQNGIRPVNSDIPIHHYAFMRPPARIQAKQELYLQLGYKKIQENPSDPKAFIELGNQYAEVRDYTNAVGAYRQALMLDPSNAQVLKDLGGALHLIRRSDDAKHALRLAVQLDPSLAEAWRNLGVIHADEKDWPASIGCFERAMELDAGWVDGHRYLSVALEGAGLLPQAAEASRKALEAGMTSEALKLYVHQMLRLERRAEARSVIAGLIGRSGGNSEFHNVLGELYYYDDLFQEAKEQFVLAGQAGSGAAYNNLGVVLYREKLYDKAKQAFEMCLQYEPNHRGAMNNLEKTLACLNGNG